jgi:hypothetical protein
MPSALVPTDDKGQDPENSPPIANAKKSAIAIHTESRGTGARAAVGVVIAFHFLGRPIQANQSLPEPRAPTSSRWVPTRKIRNQSNRGGFPLHYAV